MSTDGPKRYADKTFQGGWRTLQPIGKGNFAWVYNGLEPDGTTQCAIKVLHLRSDQAEKRFHREIKVVREIPANPFCVQYRGHGVLEDGAPWVALEYIHGVTLSAILAKGKPIRSDELMRLMLQVCRGFAGLHQFGMAHRDVKPDNIMITHPEGAVKLLDFGLVQDSQGLLKLFEEQAMVRGHDFAENLDHGMLAGTPEYMAPEQISDAMNADEAQQTDTTADVYSLAVIFFQLLTGRKLFPFVPSSSDPKGTQKEVMVYLKERVKFSDDELIRPLEVDPELWSIIRKALRKDPKARQGSALQLAGDLDVFRATGHGIPTDEDVSVTVRGLAGIPQDIIDRARNLQKKRHKPVSLVPETSATFALDERPADSLETVRDMDPLPASAFPDAEVAAPKALDDHPVASRSQDSQDSLDSLDSATSGMRWAMFMGFIAVVVAIVVAVILLK